jgi:hypothetical protein
MGPGRFKRMGCMPAGNQLSQHRVGNALGPERGKLERKLPVIGASLDRGVASVAEQAQRLAGNVCQGAAKQRNSLWDGGHGHSPFTGWQRGCYHFRAGFDAG